MILGNIPELKLIGVYDRGTPNLERIVIFVNNTVDTGQFGLMLGLRQQTGFAVPIKDNLLWFGDGIINAGDWIYIYTGPGSPRVGDIPNSPSKTYTIHWGRSDTILGNQEVVPILFRVDAVNIESELKTLPTGSVQI